MTKPNPPQAIFWNDDYPVVIIGAHLSKEDAMIMAEHDIGDIDLDYGVCKCVYHWWAQYRFLRDGDYIDCDNDLESGKDGLWFVKRTENRPKGVTQRITILEFIPNSCVPFTAGGVQ
jgi:hypothetical protein